MTWEYVPVSQLPSERPDHPAYGFTWSSPPGVPEPTVGIPKHRFGAETSGHTVLYDASGALRFHGGITAARGHEGGSAGRAAIVAAVRGEEPSSSAHVFGCSLASASANPRPEMP